MALALVLTGAACTDSNEGRRGSGGADRSSTTTTTSARSSRARWTERPCDFEIPAATTVTCGSLAVLENRRRPGGPWIDLTVVRVHSHAANPAPDPVVYLHGGPGTSTLQYGISRWAASPVLDHRDLIVFDQRGAGLSVPALECPEREAALLDTIGTASPFADELTRFEKALAACRQRLEDEGHDLDQYNSETDAADLADLRTALGIEEWNLWGEGQGTRIALVEMRDHPEGVRSATLDSPYPPSAGASASSIDAAAAAFARLVADCTADRACARRVPDLAGDLDRLVTRLDARPFRYSYPRPGKDPLRFELTGADAMMGIYNAMFHTDLIPRIPAVVHDLASGRIQLPEAIADLGVSLFDDGSPGTTLSFECADNAAREDPAAIQRLRTDPGRWSLLVLLTWNVHCGTWKVAHLRASFGLPVTSSVPTLVVSGELDPTVSPDEARRVSATLPNSVVIEVPRGGARAGADDACATDVFHRFLDDLNRVDTACVASIVPAPFR